MGELQRAQQALQAVAARAATTRADLRRLQGQLQVAQGQCLAGGAEGGGGGGGGAGSVDEQLLPESEVARLEAELIKVCVCGGVIWGRGSLALYIPLFPPSHVSSSLHSTTLHSSSASSSAAAAA